MVELESANHCVYKIRYHMVLCVKYRKKLLHDSDKIEFIKFLCSEIEQRYSIVFDTIGTDGDHLHIFVGAAPKYSPSKIMQIIKSILARELFKRYPEIKKQLWGGHFWSEGGYIGTVGWSEPLRLDKKLSNADSWREVHEEDKAALRPGLQDISISRT
jgi:putative transposase